MTNNTFYISGFNLEDVKKCLSTDFDAVTKWFYENQMALNAGKCHFMCHFQRFSNKEQQRTKKYSGLT